MTFVEYYAFRRKMVEALERDLLGPTSPDERLKEPPITRYVTGILFPTDGDRVDPAQDFEEQSVTDARADDAGLWDPAVSMSHVRYPSSMGTTFAVDTRTTKSIRVHVTAARYEPIESTTGQLATDRASSNEVPLGRRARPKETPDWQRIALDLPTVDIEVTASTTGSDRDLEVGLRLYWRVRPTDDHGNASVTIILINDRKASSMMRDADSYFQPRITVVAPSGTSAFVHRGNPESIADADLEAHRLLYRNAASIAAGHGTAVDWDTDPTDPDRAVRVFTCLIPRYELRLSGSNPDIQTDALGMAYLANGSRADVVRALHRLCDRYAQWISDTGQAVEHLDSALHPIAERHLQGCREALNRMQTGIRALELDSDAWEAFRLANRAMLMQRARSDWLARAERAAAPDHSGDHYWYPFQLAFILLCLPGIVSKESDDRDVTDLLWFPTGGGKTEAYLGLLAFTVFLRRLRDPVRGHGVTAIMRYTLRLLTIQQFERAALLICCMENIRRHDGRLGHHPIEIGLWVGRRATPNDLVEARTSIDKLRRGLPLEESNPLQLQRCPWCASPLTARRNLWLAQSPPRMVIACRSEDCDFGSELPVRVVDDDIYNRQPTLLIATADKFASMPWREQARKLFNADSFGTPPPELIIQDELHLIAGPLGTLAGLYETAIDLLCSVDGARPKVVASTATIRRADAQTRGLFARTVRQFPPPGIDAGDSFFAREEPPETRGTRLYVGVTAPGTSQTTLLVRTYSALLHAAAELDAPPDIKDPYWTLVGYFNSLRVLGGARMQVQDDVNDRLELLSRMHDTDRRDIEHRIELTSREPSSEIPHHLQRMAINYPDAQALSVILATNMISVGVDINRLGLMAVMGQPQSTSEYIQATSRVGRRHPGLVVTMLNSAKSRDRSHYESFRDYHAAMYRQVESSSVTPFSPRARGRALHAVLIALARHTVPELRPNDGARHIEHCREKLEPVKVSILDRVGAVEPDEREATADELAQIIDEWIQRARDEPQLVYANRAHPDKALLGDADLAGEDFSGTFPTLWSLRDVDQSSKLYQVT